MHTASDTSTDDDRLLTTKEVADLVGFQPGTLKFWRTQGRGPKFVKRPGSPQAPVRYYASDVEAWKAAREAADDPANWPVTETTE